MVNREANGVGMSPLPHHFNPPNVGSVLRPVASSQDSAAFHLHLPPPSADALALLQTVRRYIEMPISLAEASCPPLRSLSKLELRAAGRLLQRFRSDETSAFEVTHEVLQTTDARIGLIQELRLDEISAETFDADRLQIKWPADAPHAHSPAELEDKWHNEFQRVESVRNDVNKQLHESRQLHLQSVCDFEPFVSSTNMKSQRLQDTFEQWLNSKADELVCESFADRFDAIATTRPKSGAKKPYAGDKRARKAEEENEKRNQAVAALGVFCNEVRELSLTWCVVVREAGQLVEEMMTDVGDEILLYNSEMIEAFSGFDSDQEGFNTKSLQTGALSVQHTKAELEKAFAEQTATWAQLVQEMNSAHAKVGEECERLMAIWDDTPFSSMRELLDDKDFKKRLRKMENRATPLECLSKMRISVATLMEQLNLFAVQTLRSKTLLSLINVARSNEEPLRDYRKLLATSEQRMHMLIEQYEQGVGYGVQHIEACLREHIRAAVVRAARARRSDDLQQIDSEVVEETASPLSPESNTASNQMQEGMSRGNAPLLVPCGNFPAQKHESKPKRSRRKTKSSATAISGSSAQGAPSTTVQPELNDSYSAINSQSDLVASLLGQLEEEGKLRHRAEQECTRLTHELEQCQLQMRFMHQQREQLVQMLHQKTAQQSATQLQVCDFFHHQSNIGVFMSYGAE